MNAPAGFEAFTAKVGLNVPMESLIENIKVNVLRKLPQAWPHERQPDVDVMIVGGGPSLPDYLDDIRDRRAQGWKLIALNGAHDYLIENGITPSALVMVDGRESNAAFVRQPRNGVKYLLASQCHPAVFDALSGQQVLIWHASISKDSNEDDILKAAYPEGFAPIVGGSTVALRAIWLMHVLGFEKFHLYGIDSCVLFDDDHHAYPQPQNDVDPVVDIWCADRLFRCSPWMVWQARDFIDFVKNLGDNFKVCAYGPGLIAHILQHGPTSQLRSS